MRNSKELLKLAGIVPKLRLGNKTPKGVTSTGPHRVKILEDKVIQKPHPTTGKIIEWVRYILEENGEKRIYDTKLKDDKTGQLSYLVQRFAEVEEGSEIILAMKKQGVKNYIEVTEVSGSQRVEMHDDDSDEDSDIGSGFTGDPT